MAFNPLEHPILLTDPLRHGPTFTWKQHIPFAFLAIELLQPRTIVELGTHHGDSYCAFCQAVNELKLTTTCRAVDTWQGDPHSCHYGPEVLANLRQHHDPLYSSFSQLIQSDFDSALPLFEDGSIDFLHIDGYHTYDAVRHDYETYQSKLSDRAVVLFHDTAVRHKDFGVYRFWEEISPRFSSFAFEHGCGLGILAHGSNVPGPFADLLSQANREPETFRNFFFHQGRHVERLGMVQALAQLNFQVQGIVNQWKHQANQLPSPHSTNLNLAMSEPLTFTRHLAQDVVTALNAELAMRQQMIKYLNPAPAIGPRITAQAA